MSEITQTGGYLDVVDATLRAPRLEATSNIGIANTNPEHAFSVGSNLYVDTESSNVITVRGNVVTQGVKVGTIEIVPSYDLAAVSNVGNVTANTIIFTNETQGFVATGNATIGSTLTISGFRITAAAAAEDDLEAITTSTQDKPNAGDTTNAIRVRNGTESTSFDTGALQVGTNTGANGGLGVAGNVHVAQGVYTQDLSVSGDVVSNLAVNTDDLFVDIVNSRVGIGVTTPTAALDVVGNVAVDTNTLFVDSVNNKVGIGVTEPGATLEVTGNAYVSSNLEVGTANLFVDTVNSRVGIGVTNPDVTLAVYDISSNLTAASITTNSSGVTNETSFSILDMKDVYGAGGYIKGFHNPFVGNGLQLGGWSGGARTDELMTILATGNVGIGTTSPEVPFNVVGNNALSGTPNNVVASFRAANSNPGTNDAGVVIGSVNGNTPYIADVSSASLGLFFYTQNAERMRISSSGNIGINTTAAPACQLHITGQLLSSNTDDTNGLLIMPSGVGGGGNSNEYVTGHPHLGVAQFQSEQPASDNLPSVSIINKDRDNNVLKNASIGFFTSDTAGTSKFVGKIGYWPDDGNSINGQFRIYTVGGSAGYDQPIQRMVVTASGRVGIGTTDPNQLLDVMSDNPQMIIRTSTGGGGVCYMGNSSHGVGRGSGLTNFGDGNDTVLYTAGTGDSGIASSGGAYYIKIQSDGNAVSSDSSPFGLSDVRIKKDIIDIDDEYALQKIREIKPRLYTYKSHNKHNQTVFGFIAQEVRETLPYSTIIGTETIPNIQEYATFSNLNSNVITFTNFNTSNLDSNSNTIRVFHDDLQGREEYSNVISTVNIIRIIDDHVVEIDTDLLINDIFVDGQQVEDFHFLKKEHIFTVATAALQEVDRQLQAEKAKVTTLETQLASVLARLDALESA